MIANDEQIYLSGVSLKPEEFRCHETDSVVDFGAVQSVLNGELAAYRIVNFISAAACQAIETNFWASPARVSRLGEGEDGVEAFILGASHIEKSTDEYMADVSSTASSVASLYAGTTNPIAEFREQFAAHIEKVVCRPAKHGEKRAGDSKAVVWNNTGEFQLLPHDDIAQLSEPLQNGFEIQQVQRVMAINAYPEASSDGGELQLWNIEPDDAARRRLGLAQSGYPYPFEGLENFKSLRVSVGTGDICVINGNLVHAVIGRATSPAGSRRRLLLTCFAGQNAGGEVVWWT